jgi:twinkle protein
MSKVSMIEQRAKELDEERRIRIIKSEEVDFEKYLHSTDMTQKVRDAQGMLEEVREEFLNPQKEVAQSMPWGKTQEGFQFRAGEVTLYAGGNGGGKSMITGQIALNLIKQKQKVMIASFEMKPKRTLTRMLRQFAGENIFLPRYVNAQKYMGDLIDRLQMFCYDHLWLYDQQGTVTSKQVIAVSRYSAMELGVQHIFIDSLMKCVSGEDDYNAQKAFVDELTALARDHNVHIHLIHHIRKLASEEVQPNKNDIKGSGAISDQVDNVLMVWRNKKKEHQSQTGTADVMTPDAMLMCEKQRNGEAEDWYSLWYHKDSQQFVEQYDSVPMSFDGGGRF